MKVEKIKENKEEIKYFPNHPVLDEPKKYYVDIYTSNRKSKPQRDIEFDNFRKAFRFANKQVSSRKEIIIRDVKAEGFVPTNNETLAWHTAAQWDGHNWRIYIEGLPDDRR